MTILLLGATLFAAFALWFREADREMSVTCELKPNRSVLGFGPLGALHNAPPKVSRLT
jgi:hypothetical protein